MWNVQYLMLTVITFSLFKTLVAKATVFCIFLFSNIAWYKVLLHNFLPN